MAGSAHVLSSHVVAGYNGPLGVITTAFTGDDANGTVPTLAIAIPADAQIEAISTNPGATGPTDNYDITLLDSFGMDRLSSAGANRDTANTETAVVSGGYWLGGESLTLTVAGTSVNSATGAIQIVYRKLAQA